MPNLKRANALRQLEEESTRGGISRASALMVLTWPPEQLFDLLALTDRVRRRHKDDRVKFCSISNAKSGKCPEDCAFCAQSTRYRTGIKEYRLKDPQKLLAEAKEAEKFGAREFSIVTSGRKITPGKELDQIVESVRLITRETNLEVCASLGLLDYEQLLRLRESGLVRYHHNLETGPRYFPRICTTHSFNDNVASVMEAKKAGLKVCSGGIFGMGESLEDRVEMLSALSELDVDSIPVNFLNPIPGTPLENHRELSAIDCLLIIACTRLMMPSRDIVICGGREVNLRDLQSLMFAAGANGILAGNYLTTPGRPAEQDMQLIEDLGLTLIASSNT